MKTKTIVLSEKNFPSAVEAACSVLRKGGLVVYPTETCYGLGCIATDGKAVAKVFAAKRRGPEKALSIIVSGVPMAEKFAVLDGCSMRLAKKFFPGPLTLVTEKTQAVPDVLSKDGIAFRVSSNRFACAVVEALGAPIVSSSANFEDEPEIYSGNAVAKKFSGTADLVVNAGVLEKNVPSTIFDCRAKMILREGAISAKEVFRALS
ncbi:MAG: threonylcarbamoyl-AMP synthase [Candidatus Diapherotrites archaeon]|nr:threonylcarbamoyl-AMP synthase [Candidatus Diapherotrites archaeon]